MCLDVLFVDGQIQVKEDVRSLMNVPFRIVPNDLEPEFLKVCREKGSWFSGERSNISFSLFSFSFLVLDSLSHFLLATV